MVQFIFQVLTASVGTIAFSIMYNVSKKHFLYCGICGAAGWMVYLILRNRSDIAGVFLGAFLVVLLSRYFSVTRECPVTIFLIPGIFPLVPGKGIYQAVYHIIIGSYYRAIHHFVTAFKYSFAIAMAISVGVILQKIKK